MHQRISHCVLSPFILAIDGPAASGKGTIAKGVAKILGFKHFNTGLLYRWVALSAITSGVDFNIQSEIIKIAKACTGEIKECEELYSSHVSVLASKCAAIQEVRDALFEIQRSFSKNSVGIVVEGRDIGTVIFPEADLKIYVTAEPKVRAQRRLKELRGRGENLSLEDVERDIRKRDFADSKRNSAPLRQGPEYIEVDTTHMNKDAAINYVFNVYNAKRL
ncbi:MAG: (d)CMP kinase [Proteobacteria bacterium]|nr:(d)CMP kinase [Pseudomonadota bacterium]